MHVNGAGDIFCGIFLYTLYNKCLKEAIKTSCQKTTKNLIKINEI
jgi:sugar/nucleoside kinase (ribokinase family)